MKKPPRASAPRLTVVPASSLAFVVGGDGETSKPKSMDKQHALVLALVKG